MATIGDSAVCCVPSYMCDVCWLLLNTFVFWLNTWLVCVGQVCVSVRQATLVLTAQWMCPRLQSWSTLWEARSVTYARAPALTRSSLWALALPTQPTSPAIWLLYRSVCASCWNGADKCTHVLWWIHTLPYHLSVGLLYLTKWTQVLPCTLAVLHVHIALGFQHRSACTWLNGSDQCIHVHLKMCTVLCDLSIIGQLVLF